MPVYEYACTDCSEQLEVRQSFTDDALTVCPTCEGGLRKILSAVGVVFKGSGFYRNDSRSKSTSDSDTSSSDKPNETASSSDSSGSESKKPSSSDPSGSESKKSPSGAGSRSKDASSSPPSSG